MRLYQLNSKSPSSPTFYVVARSADEAVTAYEAYAERHGWSIELMGQIEILAGTWVEEAPGIGILVTAEEGQ